MSIEKLERVMWRLRKGLDPAYNPTRAKLDICIMKECGTSPSTLKANKAALKKLGWIKFQKGASITITGADINES